MYFFSFSTDSARFSYLLLLDNTYTHVGYRSFHFSDVCDFILLGHIYILYSSRLLIRLVRAVWWFMAHIVLLALGDVISLNACEIFFRCLNFSFSIAQISYSTISLS